MNNHEIEFNRLINPGVFIAEEYKEANIKNIYKGAKSTDLKNLLKQLGKGIFLLNICREPCVGKSVPKLIRQISIDHKRNLSGKRILKRYKNKIVRDIFNKVKIKIKENKIINPILFINSYFTNEEIINHIFIHMVKKNHQLYV